MTDTPWPEMTGEQRREIVKTMWLAGRSSGQIASNFPGSTRNAIIGIVHRMKLKSMPRDSITKSTPTKIPKPKPIKPIVIDVPAAPISETVETMISDNRSPLFGVDPISILDLPPRKGTRCRFPVIGGYCGAASGENTYCPTHHKLCHTRKE